MNHRLLWVVIGSAAGLGLLHVGCSSDDFSTPDAGPDAEADVGVDVARDTAPTPDAVADVAPDVVDAGPPPRCDANKPFGPVAKVLLNGNDVTVDAFGSFRVDADESHAWVQKNDILRQYTLAGTTLTHQPAIADLPVTQGFGISPNGLELVEAQATGLYRRTRGSVTSGWSGATPITLPIVLPSGAAYQQIYYPQPVGQALYFSRFVYYSAQPSLWDVGRAAPGDGGLATTFFAELHDVQGDFTNEPVLAGETTIYFGRWGSTKAYPSIFRATRASASASWSGASEVTLPNLTVGKKDTFRPLAVTPDDCSLYVAFAPDGDASSFFGPFVVYVAHRPL